MKKFNYLIMALAVIPLSVWAAPLRLGVVLDKGGRDDKSFNAAAYLGA